MNIFSSLKQAFKIHTALNKGLRVLEYNGEMIL